MASALREAVRWMKRQRLEYQLDRAPGEAKKLANSELNWREFWHGRTHLYSRPRFVQVGTNWTCNLKCNFCRLTLEETQKTLKAKPKNELEISPRVLDHVLELMPYPEMITLTPLGEPLLYSKVGLVLEHHRRIGSRNLAMTTNANLINDERARMIVEGGVSHLFVSIDSSDPDIYASMRVLGNLPKVEAALESINRWKDKLNSPTPTMTLASTFMERNVRTMPDLLDFGVRHRFHSFSIQLMETENLELESEFLGHHMPIAKEMLLETLRRSQGKPIEVKVNIAFRNLLTHMLSLPEARLIDSALEGAPSGDTADTPMDPDSPIASLSTKSKHLTEKCHYPWYMLLIDTDGDSRPCCWAGSSYGNLNSLTLEDIWNGPSTQQMRTEFLNNHIPKGCQHKHCRVDLDHDGTLEL